ncbi:hypothetical protein WA158_007430 [Blastocystis sp. Blastoise]
MNGQIDPSILEDSVWDELDLESIWKSKEADNFFQDIEESPLFFDEINASNSNNTTLQALQSLAYDEQSPEEIVENQIYQAEQSMKRGPPGYITAMEAYNEAIDQAKKIENKELMNLKLSEVYCYRCQLQLTKKNFRSAINDANDSLKYKPNNTKALYRKVRGLMELYKFMDALEELKVAETILGKEEWIDKLRNKSIYCQKLKDKQLEEIEKKRIEKELKEQDVQAKCIQKGYKIGPKIFENLQYDAKMSLEKDSHGKVTINFPMLFLYPEYQQSDSVLGDANNRAPWDKDYIYRPDNIDVWFQEWMVLPYTLNRPKEELIHHFKEQHWVRIDPNMTISTLLSYEKYCIPEAIVLHIVPKKSPYLSNMYKSMTTVPYVMDIDGHIRQIHKCQKCGKYEENGQLYKKCSKCRSVYYCSRDCQVNDWKNHKEHCKAPTYM